jgi:cleavage and polyadenylation specificity factor subunit 2
MSLVGDTVLVTPFYNENDDGVCNLLEIGNATCLLDCGCCNHDSVDLLNRIQLELGKRNKGLDAVIISHADVQHMGALPYILGKNGFRNVEVICTLPVHKFGQMLLYDYCSNRDMEGEETKSSHKSSFDYDDIDMALSSVNVVKFSQKVKITSKFSDSSMSFIAYPSGRTIGGSIWSIQCGSTDVLYTIDLNLRKEVVLDGVSLDLLPTVPSLLIIDSGSTISTSDKISTTSKSHKKEKDDPNKLINSIMETMRSEGNVLLPCETAGHTLEMMQILATYWQNNKLGMYHLIYLSPMAFNVIEFARSQLEWMSDTLSRSFYNGRPNPFELPYMKICTSMSDIERLYPGPKTVLATDSSLSFGFSKEILLRWGGNPLNKVIFTDISVAESLAVELRQQTVPPIIATVTRPVRVQLVGKKPFLELYKHCFEYVCNCVQERS